VVVRVLLPAAVLLYTHDPVVFRDNDTGSYLYLADALLRAGRFGGEGAPDIVRTPGYPLLLIPGLALGRLEPVTIALQIALSVITVALVFGLARALSERRDVAGWAALLYAVEPLSIIYASKLLSETLFTALVTATAYAVTTYVRTPTAARALTVAVAAAAAAYVRPIGYFLPIVTALGLAAVAIAQPRRRSPRRLLGHVVVLLVVAMALTGVWRVRNWVEAGYPGFAAISDVNLYFYLGASVRAAQDGVPYAEMQRRMGYYDHDLYLRLHPEQRGWTAAQRYTSMGDEGRRIVLGAPLTYAWLHLDGIVRMLIAPGATDVLGFFRRDAGLAGYLGIFVDEGVVRGVVRLFHARPAVFWSNLLLVPLLIVSLALAALGLGSWVRRGDAATIVIAAIAVYLLLVAGGPAAYARFRHPIMPIVCVYAALGLERLRRRGVPGLTTTARTVRAPEIGGA
jgi:hypothetical protein